MGNTPGQGADGLHLLGLPESLLRLPSLLLYEFDSTDVGGDMQPDIASVNPSDGAIMVQIPTGSFIVHRLPHLQVTGIAQLIQQLDIPAMFTRFLSIVERLPARLIGQVIFDDAAHVAIHENDLMGLQVGRIDDGIDTVQDG